MIYRSTYVIKNALLQQYGHAQKRLLQYVQGQEPEPKIREYFYYIDHQGMVCNLVHYFEVPTYINVISLAED